MTKPKYIPPGKVCSPKRHWKLLSVLDPGAENTGSVALGRWGEKPVLAIRWNGSADNPLGNPQSRGLATWFIIPDAYTRPILSTFSAEKQSLAKTFLSGS